LVRLLVVVGTAAFHLQLWSVACDQYNNSGSCLQRQLQFVNLYFIWNRDLLVGVIVFSFSIVCNLKYLSGVCQFTLNLLRASLFQLEQTTAPLIEQC
jgi:hypothetical protein